LTSQLVASLTGGAFGPSDVGNLKEGYLSTPNGDVRLGEVAVKLEWTDWENVGDGGMPTKRSQCKYSSYHNPPRVYSAANGPAAFLVACKQKTNCPQSPPGDI